MATGASRSRTLRSVTQRDLHEHRRALTAWGLGCLALALTMTALYPAVRGNPELARLHDSYPEALRALFDIGDLTSAVGFLRAELFSLTGPLLLVLLAVSWGSDLVAGEEERGTIDLLLANPISRRQVALEKWVALATGTVLVTACLGVGLAVGLPAAGMHLDAAHVLSAVVATGMLGLLFGSIAFALGAATGRRGLARGVTALLAVAAYLASTLSPLVHGLGALRQASPWYHALGVDPLATGFAAGHLLVLVGMTAAAVGTGLVAFDHRDLGTA